MEEVFNNTAQLPYWQKAAKGEAVNWNEVFQGYHAAVDWPSGHYWRELAEFYPDAKVLLSVRPAELWWSSYSETIKRLLEIKDNIPDKYPRSILTMADEIITQQTFNGSGEHKDQVLSAFQKRIDDVKEAIPSDRLLIFQVTEGWKPLCEFLDVQVPEGDFPRSNAKVEFWDVFGGGA